MAWWRSSNWDQFRNLSWPERLLLAQALVALPFTALGLRLLGLERWQTAIRRLSPPQPTHGVNATSVARLVRAAASHGPYHASCLVRSCAVWWLLQRHGVGSDLRIGVRKEGGALMAHAWVEQNGQVLTDLPDVADQYLPLAYPPETQKAE